MLRVRVRYEDKERRRELKRAGFRWNPQRQLWEGEDTLANRELLDRLGLQPEAPLLPHEGKERERRELGVIGEYIYDFTTKEGKRMVGISWAGAKRLAQTYLPGLDVELVRVDQNDQWIAVVVKAKWEKGSALGAAQMPVTARFAYTVAINKAQRNAIMNLLDEALIKRALQRYGEGEDPCDALSSGA
uniref:Uncharacterized protein n=1 Tax=uncultured prokaryote TaxID=198431 RepID=H5S958_9ZZZZ|nr:hypothetical protein HGMM_F03A04C17 [uncultured prokaryote]